MLWSEVHLSPGNSQIAWVLPTAARRAVGLVVDAHADTVLAAVGVTDVAWGLRVAVARQAVGLACKAHADTAFAAAVVTDMTLRWRCWISTLLLLTSPRRTLFSASVVTHADTSLATAVVTDVTLRWRCWISTLLLLTSPRRTLFSASVVTHADASLATAVVTDVTLRWRWWRWWRWWRRRRRLLLRLTRPWFARVGHAALALRATVGSVGVAGLYNSMQRRWVEETHFRRAGESQREQQPPHHKRKTGIPMRQNHPRQNKGLKGGCLERMPQALH